MDLTDEQLTDMVETNISGTIWPIRAAVPTFRDHGGGDIVIVAPVAGLRGAGDEAVYAATKFAQVGLAGGLDRELLSDGIRVSTLAPGGTATEFAMGAGRTPDTPGLADMMSAEDVAAAIATVLRQPRSTRSPAAVHAEHAGSGLTPGGSRDLRDARRATDLSAAR